MWRGCNAYAPVGAPPPSFYLPGRQSFRAVPCQKLGCPRIARTGVLVFMRPRAKRGGGGPSCAAKWWRGCRPGRFVFGEGFIMTKSVRLAASLPSTKLRRVPNPHHHHRSRSLSSGRPLRAGPVGSLDGPPPPLSRGRKGLRAASLLLRALGRRWRRPALAGKRHHHVDGEPLAAEAARDLAVQLPLDDERDQARAEAELARAPRRRAVLLDPVQHQRDA